MCNTIHPSSLGIHTKPRAVKSSTALNQDLTDFAGVTEERSVINVQLRSSADREVKPNDRSDVSVRPDASDIIVPMQETRSLKRTVRDGEGVKGKSAIAGDRYVRALISANDETLNGTGTMWLAPVCCLTVGLLLVGCLQTVAAIPPKSEPTDWYNDPIRT
uniref:Uncharacterized protein n=1 Tax=Anopheles farauti TaxID=69004 RepID=A0A182QWH1_9DIPT